jgi:hypothetical protein
MPRVTMKLSAKEKKEGRDLRDYMVVPIKGAANRRRMGGAAMLVKKSDMPKEEKKPQKKIKEPRVTLLVTSNSVDDAADELADWDDATIDVVKIFPADQRDDAQLSADESASGSNVDFIVYEVREIYRAKRGL